VNFPVRGKVTDNDGNVSYISFNYHVEPGQGASWAGAFPRASGRAIAPAAFENRQRKIQDCHIGS